MEKSQHRHDISDKAWAILEPMLPGQRGQWGGIAEDNRRFINGVFWILRTGAPWRDLPPDYGKWGTVHQRFRRWRDKGIWEKILEALIDDPDYEWLMIDAKQRHIAASIVGCLTPPAVRRYENQRRYHPVTMALPSVTVSKTRVSSETVTGW